MPDHRAVIAITIPPKPRRADLTALAQIVVDAGVENPIAFASLTMAQLRTWIESARRKSIDAAHAAATPAETRVTSRNAQRADDLRGTPPGSAGFPKRHLTAAECNENLRSMPEQPGYGDACQCQMCKGAMT